MPKDFKNFISSNKVYQNLQNIIYFYFNKKKYYIIKYFKKFTSKN